MVVVGGKTYVAGDAAACCQAGEDKGDLVEGLLRSYISRGVHAGGVGGGGGGLVCTMIVGCCVRLVVDMCESLSGSGAVFKVV